MAFRCETGVGSFFLITSQVVNIFGFVGQTILFSPVAVYKQRALVFIYKKKKAAGWI